MSKLITYIKESYDELVRKVSWPKFADLQNSSILVLVASLIFALLIGVIDLAFENAMSWFYNEF
ncbi:MAG: preprotein translocase subunit SecE [Cyclobacteriaceae bacterium]|jgi:preprotein translocase subunit SecE